MARKVFPTFKRLVLSCGCTIGVGSNVDPAAVDKCPNCRVKVTAAPEPAPASPIPKPPPLAIVPDNGAQLRLAL